MTGAPAAMNGFTGKSKSICILGMHRSGTSAIARAMNLLGAYLGEDEDLMPPTRANPEGYWERLDICNLHGRLLAHLKRTWDTAAPLPDRWHLSDEIRPFREELKWLVAANLAHHPLWAWKDPRTCILLPLWREVLAELGVELSCVFVVRSPLDVANSLRTRDRIPLDKAFGMWFNHNIVALRDAAEVPTVFLSYDRLLESWEPELRRCAAALGLDWPADERRIKEMMNAFIRPNLRHSRTNPEKLQGAPQPVRELYGILIEVIDHPSAPDGHFRDTVGRLSRNFDAYASFFESDLDNLFVARITHPPVDAVFVIAVGNQWDHAARCLKSLSRSGVPDTDVVLVVDNASTDGTREFLAARPDLRVLCNHTSPGRSAAWNQGASATDSTWIVILDSEAIVAPGFLEGLAAFAREQRSDIVSPAMVEGDLDYDFLTFAEEFTRKMRFACRHGVAWGLSFMVHRRVLDTVGPFDTQADLAGQEHEDFFRRARRAGFRLAVTGRAYLHTFGAPAGRGPESGVNLNHGASPALDGYYRKKHDLTWLRRNSSRLREQIRGAFWRWNERRRFSMTLRMRRQDGQWRYE